MKLSVRNYFDRYGATFLNMYIVNLFRNMSCDMCHVDIYVDKASRSGCTSNWRAVRSRQDEMISSTFTLHGEKIAGTQSIFKHQAFL